MERGINGGFADIPPEPVLRADIGLQLRLCRTEHQLAFGAGEKIKRRIDGVVDNRRRLDGHPVSDRPHVFVVQRCTHHGEQFVGRRAVILAGQYRHGYAGRLRADNRNIRDPPVGAAAMKLICAGRPGNAHSLKGLLDAQTIIGV
ncbi:hypothetical protein D3C72_1727610 [compost metagenome]